MGFGKKEKGKKAQVLTPLEQLFQALDNGEDQEKIRELAVADGLDINGKNPDGDTLLTHAAVKGDADSVETLVNQGCEVNGTDNEGNTPLHIAAYNGFASLVKILLNLGADRNILNSSDQTPAELAQLGEHNDIVAIINPPKDQKKESKKERKAREKAEAEAKKKADAEAKKEEEAKRIAEEKEKLLAESEAAAVDAVKSHKGSIDMEEAPASPTKSVKSVAHNGNSAIPTFPSAFSVSPAKSVAGESTHHGTRQATSASVLSNAAAPQAVRKRGGKYEELTRMTTQAAGKIVASNINKGMQLMQIHVYGIGFVRSVRETLYWLSMGDLILTLVGFTLIYLSFISNHAYNMIWLSVFHWPRSILGLLLIQYVPQYEKVSANVLAAMGESNTDPNEAIKKLKTYLKRKMKKARKFLIPYLICCVITIFLDILSLLCLLWGTFTRDDGWTFITFFVLAFVFMDLYGLFWLPTVKYGLPEALYKKLKSEIPSLSEYTKTHAESLAEKFKRKPSSANEPGADLEDAIAMEEGRSAAMSDPDEVTLD